MKRLQHLLAGTLVIALLSATVHAQRRAEPPRADDDRALLQAHIARLEARIARLEREVQQLRTQRGREVPPQPRVAPPAPAIPGQPIPPAWQRREFNGLPYYLIPLEKPADATAPQPPPTSK